MKTIYSFSSFILFLTSLFFWYLKCLFNASIYLGLNENYLILLGFSDSDIHADIFLSAGVEVGLFSPEKHPRRQF